MTEQTSTHQQSVATRVAHQRDVPTSTVKNLVIFTKHTWQIVGVVAITAIVGLIAVLFLPTKMAGAAMLTVFCIGLWATAVVSQYWPAFLFFLIAVVFEIAPAETVFSGFHSSTFWLLFSGIILGAAIGYTGLGQRAAVLLSKGLGRRYTTIIFGIVFFSLALAFVMPSSMGRVVLLIPIIIALADHMDYSSGSNGRIGMLTAATFGTCLPAFAILPANAPNMMLAGMAENLYGYQLAYWNYLLLHFPVLGILKAVFLILLILWMFPDCDPTYKPASQRMIAPMTAEEYRLVAVLGLCLALWLTDSLHHISPGWIGLAAALYCLWPYSNLTSKKCLNEDINYNSLFFIAGIMGLGAVISATGLGEVVVQTLSEQADFSVDRPLWNITALTAISTLVAIVTNLPSVPAIMTPIAENLANLTGLPLTTVLMTQVLAFSNIFLPHQVPPLVTAMQIAHLPNGAITKLCLALFAISVLILTPLDLLWWYNLGLF